MKVDGPTGDMTIHPTHTCFDDALDYLQQRIKQNGHRIEGLRLVLIHAICIVPEGPDAGERFSHAWVEEDLDNHEAAVWQQGFYNGQRIIYASTRASVYETLRVVRTWGYSPEAAWEENNRTATYGPWVPELQALCRRKKEAST